MLNVGVSRGESILKVLHASARNACGSHTGRSRKAPPRRPSSVRGCKAKGRWAVAQASVFSPVLANLESLACKLGAQWPGIAFWRGFFTIKSCRLCLGWSPVGACWPLILLSWKNIMVPVWIFQDLHYDLDKNLVQVSSRYAKKGGSCMWTHSLCILPQRRKPLSPLATSKE